MSSLSKIISSSASSSGDEEVVDELRRGPWTLEEDTLLIRFIACHGEGRWNLLAKHSGLRRTGKSCRLRWLNYLKPDVKHGNLTPEEQLLILQLHAKWGNRWSKIAQYLPGRTDNEIKNYWRTRVQKQARHLKIDCNSREFQELIRCFWMPRLLQKIRGSSSPSNVQFQDLTAANQQVHPTSHVDKSESGKSSCSNERLTSIEDSTLLESPVLSSQHVWQNSATNSTILCSAEESVKIMSNAPRISEYPTSPSIRALGNFNEEYHHNPFLEGVYKADHNISSYGIESFSIPTMEEAPAGDFGNSLGCCIDNELPESLWNMDEEYLGV